MIYRTRPRDRVSTHHAARYEAPGRPLDELLEVARMKDPDAALGECADLGVLVVRYLDVPDDHRARLRYEVVPEGHYLVYSDDYHLLYSDDARSFESWLAGCNPGGEVQGAGPVPDAVVQEHVPAEHRERLLSYAELEALHAMAPWPTD